MGWQPPNGWQIPHMGEFDSNYYVVWRMAPHCNLRCPYCETWSNVAQRVQDGQLWWENKDAIRAWDRAAEDHGPITILFAGAEGTTRLPLAGRVMRNHYGVMSTNLTTDLQKYEEHVPDPTRIRIYPSFQPLAWNRDAKKFIAKAKLMSAAGYAITSASIVAWPPFLDEIAKWVAELQEAELFVTIHPFRGTWNGKAYPESYTPEEHDLVESFLEEKDKAFRLEMKRPDIAACAAGMYHAYIEFDGTVGRCLAGVADMPKQNFYKHRLQWMQEPAPCPHAVCFCNDLHQYHIPKVAKVEE